MKIRPFGAQLFNADRKTDRHDEAISRFSQFCKCGKKILRERQATVDNMALAHCMLDTNAHIPFV